MKSILDRTFRYTPAAKTDIAKTFARIRKEQEAAKRERTVIEIKGRAKA